MVISATYRIMLFSQLRSLSFLPVVQVLFIDRLIIKDKKANQKRLEKYVRKYGAGGAE